MCFEFLEVLRNSGMLSQIFYLRFLVVLDLKKSIKSRFRNIANPEEWTWMENYQKYVTNFIRTGNPNGMNT